MATAVAELVAQAFAESVEARQKLVKQVVIVDLVAGSCLVGLLGSLAAAERIITFVVNLAVDSCWVSHLAPWVEAERTVAIGTAILGMFVEAADIVAAAGIEFAAGDMITDRSEPAACRILVAAFHLKSPAGQ